MYTDDTILTFGPYKFTRLCRVPADYLLELYKTRKQKYQQLIKYIEKNLDKIKAIKEGKITPPPLGITCEKVIFPSEKEAKREIKRIAKLEQKHKKPVRTYECEDCGGWHLTSIPFEEWEKIKVPYRWG